MAPTMEWGLPPFQGIAQSYDVAEQGSLVIDLYSQSRKFVVWRGMAQANINLERSDARRNKNISKLIGELFSTTPSRARRRSRHSLWPLHPVSRPAASD